MLPHATDQRPRTTAAVDLHWCKLTFEIGFTDVTGRDSKCRGQSCWSLSLKCRCRWCQSGPWTLTFAIRTYQVRVFFWHGRSRGSGAVQSLLFEFSSSFASSLKWHCRTLVPAAREVDCKKERQSLSGACCALNSHPARTSDPTGPATPTPHSRAATTCATSTRTGR